MWNLYISIFPFFLGFTLALFWVSSPSLDRSFVLTNEQADYYHGAFKKWAYITGLLLLIWLLFNPENGTWT